MLAISERNQVRSTRKRLNVRFPSVPLRECFETSGISGRTHHEVEIQNWSVFAQSGNETNFVQLLHSLFTFLQVPVAVLHGDVAVSTITGFLRRPVPLSALFATLAGFSTGFAFRCARLAGLLLFCGLLVTSSVSDLRLVGF